MYEETGEEREEDEETKKKWKKISSFWSLVTCSTNEFIL
jgi:hypothetical protein